MAIQNRVESPSVIPLRYTRESQRLYCHGIDLNDPVDSIKEAHFPILENLRSYTSGVIQPRQGITQISANVLAGKTPVHSVRRLNNKLNNTFTRIVGVGTALATGQTSFSQVQYNSSNLVMSGNPLAMVPWRPSQSPVSWMYIADSSISSGGGLGLVKLTYDGSSTTVHQVGLTPPFDPPVAELAAPIMDGTQFGTYTDILSTAFGGLTYQADGTVSTTYTTGTRIAGITLLAILRDNVGSSWVSLVPNSMTNIGPGMILRGVQGISQYPLQVAEVYRAGSLTGNTVGSILYDNSATNIGLCTIVPAASISEIQRNAVVRINGGSNYYRILEVIYGPNNSILAFRINSGAVTITAGQSLSIASSFRVYDSFGILITDTLNSDYISAIFAPSGGTLVGSVTSVNTALALDTTQTTSVGVSDSDYFHYSLKVSDLSQMVQGRIMFDLDDGTFTKNYFYRAFTPSDLVAIAKGNQTVLGGTSTEVQNKILTRKPPNLSPIVRPSPINDSSDFSRPVFNDDEVAPNGPLVDKNPNSPRDQTGTGDNQWSELKFRRGDCVRVGTDWSKGWQIVNAIRFEITLISGAGAATVQFSSLGIRGGASPDIGDIGAPYLYRYRYRSSLTGVASNWSPATRSGLLAYRNTAKITASLPFRSPEVDKIDFQRWGGLVTDWANIGTNPIGSLTFEDKIDDDTARSTVPASVMDVNFQPWLIPQKPVSGTATTVAGTLVKDSGTNFNIFWVKGTPIKVGTFYTSIRRVISTSLLEVEDCIGTMASAVWEIAEPFLASQPLPCFWGPFNGWFFGCGDSVNPGRLYWSNQNNPDSTQDSNWLEVTAPSEPLQNGFVYNGRCYVFTPERMIEIVEISPGAFIPRDVPTGKGLMYRWAFAVGPRIWFLSKDGIYETDGGLVRSITFDTLFPVFPKEGQLGTLTNGFYPPNMTTGNIVLPGMLTGDVSTFFRMAYYDDYLFFDYPDTNNRLRCLVYANAGTNQTGWFPDVYNPGGNNTGICCHYGEEGDSIHSLLLGGADVTSGVLYTYGGINDNGTAIPWHLRQSSFDAGDKRADKLWADFIVDANPGAGSISVAAGINNYGSTLSINPTSITGSGRKQVTFDINSGDGVEAKNLAVDLSGTAIDASLYIIEPSFTGRPEDSFLRATQYDDCGYEGEKFFQGIEIEADTKGVNRTIQIRSDTNILQDTLTINHSIRFQKPYSFVSGFVAHMARLLPTDSNLWKLFRWRWIYEPEPPLVTVWDTQQTSFGYVGFVHMKALWITHTSTADLTLTITRMDDNTSKVFTIPNSGGVRGKESYLLLGPADFVKGKTYKFKITQANNIPFRIYQKHCGVMVKPWGSEEQFSRWIGWGADSGDGKAQI